MLVTPTRETPLIAPPVAAHSWKSLFARFPPPVPGKGPAIAAHIAPQPAEDDPIRKRAAAPWWTASCAERRHNRCTDFPQASEMPTADPKAKVILAQHTRRATGGSISKQPCVVLLQPAAHRIHIRIIALLLHVHSSHHARHRNLPRGAPAVFILSIVHMSSYSPRAASRGRTNRG